MTQAGDAPLNSRCVHDNAFVGHELRCFTDAQNDRCKGRLGNSAVLFIVVLVRERALTRQATCV